MFIPLIRYYIVLNFLQYKMARIHYKPPSEYAHIPLGTSLYIQKPSRWFIHAQKVLYRFDVGRRWGNISPSIVVRQGNAE